MQVSNGAKTALDSTQNAFLSPTHPNPSKRIPTHPNSSQLIPTHSYSFLLIPTHPNSSNPNPSHQGASHTNPILSHLIHPNPTLPHPIQTDSTHLLLLRRHPISARIPISSQSRPNLVPIPSRLGPGQRGLCIAASLVRGRDIDLHEARRRHMPSLCLRTVLNHGKPS